MEIWKAVADSGDRRLQAKFKQALHAIERTLALYKFNEVAFSFNGGKDSTVLLHLLRAGYAAAETKAGLDTGGNVQFKLQHPIRTIYFESPDAFPEIDLFTNETAKLYNLEMEILRLDFKSGLEALQRTKPIKAIFLGTRIGDPNAVGQEQFSPSSAGWPAFMRVNPILNWSYRDIWAFLLSCKVPYCKLYDQGYTSIGSIHDTKQNDALCIESYCTLDKDEHMAQPGIPTLHIEKKYRPAYLLRDGRLERAGRVKSSSKLEKSSSIVSNGDIGTMSCAKSLFAASILVVGDEILRGEVEDTLGQFLIKKLHSIGWAVTRRAVVPNDVDAISEEVEQRTEVSDLVLITGGVGSMHSDVSLAGVAKAFGVRLAPDEELEECLRHEVGDSYTGDQNEMAKLPEGITELLHHKDICVPLVKCHNVIVLSGKTVGELDLQWQCLIDLSKDRGLFCSMQPFTSVKLCTTFPEMMIAGQLTRIDSEFPDLSIGCYRDPCKSLVQSRTSDSRLVVSIVGKVSSRVDSAVETLCAAFPEGTFYKMC